SQEKARQYEGMIALFFFYSDRAKPLKNCKYLQRFIPKNRGKSPTTGNLDRLFRDKAEINFFVRKRYGMPLEKLVWLKSFMLQEKADHFQAAVRMMQHGLAVFIFTDLEKSFDMDADIAIADMLELGYCRYDHPHAYIFICVNPIINKILTALKKPVRLEISDKVYKARWAANDKFRVQDDAEFAVLDAMRDNVKRFIVTARDKEILLELEQELQEGTDLNTAVGGHDFQTVTIKRHEGKNVRISRTMPKKISRQKIRKLVAVQLNE